MLKKKSIPIPGLPPALVNQVPQTHFPDFLNMQVYLSTSDWKNMHPFTLINELIVAT